MRLFTVVTPGTSSPAGHVPTVAVGQLRPYAASPSTTLSGSPVAATTPSIEAETNPSGAIGPGSFTE